MKRVVCLVVITSICTSLFSFSVFAAPSMGISISTSISSDDNNITAYAYAVYEEGVYQTSTSGTNLSLPSFMISIRIVNNTDKWIVKDTDQFKIRLNGNIGVSYPFECIDIDNCQITDIDTSSGKVDFSIKADNSLILAPNETYVISFRFINSAGFTTTPSLQFFNNQFTNTTYTIEELTSLPADQLAYLSSINSNLSSLIDELVYNGTLNSIIPNANTQMGSSTFNVNNKLEIRGTRTKSRPVIESMVYYLNPATDTYSFEESCYFDVDYYFRYRNISEYVYKLDRISNSFNFELLGNQTTYQTEILLFDSDLFENYQIAQGSGVRYIQCYPSYTESDRYILVPPGDNVLHYRVRYKWIRNSTSTLPDLPAFDILNVARDITLFNATLLDYEIPSSERSILFRIYQSLIKPNSQDNTEEASDMNDEIHEEEQVWYDNNSDALEAVGLSNYRFSQSQSSGISSAVSQFQTVWNALGDWTNVYIFILILSISTYIIRHEPTTRVKQYRSSVAAERAERISYYGKRNAQARAGSSSSGSSTLKDAIRRRG